MGVDELLDAAENPFPFKYLPRALKNLANKNAAL
jgi:hypothetical protein